MPLGILFWVIYVIAILFGIWSSYEAGQPLWVKRAGAYGILWLLVGMLGWATFGPVIKQPTMLILLIVLILLFGLGGNFFNDGAWRGPGFGLGGLLLIVLLVLLITGRL